MFTLRQLEALVALDDMGSVSAASQRLEISQAAASSLLAGLEGELGLPILKNRRGARAELTSEARQLVTPARNIVEHAHQLAGLAKRMSSTFHREICVAARPHIVDQWLRQAAIQLEHETANLTISIVRGTNEEIIEQVITGQAVAGYVMIEAGLITLPSRKLAELAAGMFVAPSHPLATARNPTAADIASFGFILPPKGTSLERRILERLSRAGIHSVYASGRTEHHETLKLLALAGNGIGIMFKSEAAREVKNGQLRQLPLELASVEVRVVWQGLLDEAAVKLGNSIAAEDLNV